MTPLLKLLPPGKPSDLTSPEFLAAEARVRDAQRREHEARELAKQPEFLRACGVSDKHVRELCGALALEQTTARAAVAKFVADASVGRRGHKPKNLGATST
jgi:hypothetical protein